MYISFQNTKFANPKPTSTLKNTINTADLQYSGYSEKTIKLKEDWKMFPYAPLFFGIMFCNHLNEKKSLTKIYPLITLVTVGLYSAYSLWSANKSKQSEKAALNSILNTPLKTYAEPDDKQQEYVNMHNDIALYLFGEQKRNSIFYNYEYNKQAKFLKEISRESKTKRNDTTPQYSEITTILEDLDHETKKKSNKVKNIVNLLSFLTCGLGLLLTSTSKKNSTIPRVLKTFTGIGLAIAPFIFMQSPFVKNIDKIARYKAKEELFNSENSQNKKSGYFKTFIDYCKDYKKNIENIRTLDAQTKARNELMQDVNLTPKQEKYALLFKKEFEDSLILLDKKKNSSKKTLLKDLSNNLLFYVPQTLFLTTLTKGRERLGNKFLMLMLPKFAIDIIIDNVEL